MRGRTRQATPRRGQAGANREGAAARGRSGRGRGDKPKHSDEHSDRIQKVLAAAGIGSRREVERWIRDGRLKLNGAVPELGARLSQRDRITLDGRPVRIHADAKDSRVLLYHRSPGDTLDIKAATARAAEHLKLPRAAGRWLAIQKLPPVDGGLEILTDDGAFAHKVSRGAHALTVDFMLRVRGPLNAALLEEFLAATECEGEAMQIVRAEAQYGEGANHWLTVTVRATRSAAVRHWWAARGVIVSRLMRIRFGPVHLSRDLPRGRSRALLPAERNALMNEINAAGATPRPGDAAAGAESAGGRASGHDAADDDAAYDDAAHDDAADDDAFGDAAGA